MYCIEKFTTKINYLEYFLYFMDINLSINFRHMKINKESLGIYLNVSYPMR